MLVVVHLATKTKTLPTELCVARQQLVLVLRGMQVDLAKRGEEDELRCCYHLINRGLTSSTTLVNEIFA